MGKQNYKTDSKNAFNIKNNCKYCYHCVIFPQRPYFLIGSCLPSAQTGHKTRRILVFTCRDRKGAKYGRLDGTALLFPHRKADDLWNGKTRAGMAEPGSAEVADGTTG